MHFVYNARTYAQVQPSKDTEKISICSINMVAARSRVLSPDIRLRYFTKLHQSSTANRWIWDGDFNTGLNQAAAHLQGQDSEYFIVDHYASHVHTSTKGKPLWSMKNHIRSGHYSITSGLTSSHKVTYVELNPAHPKQKHDVVVTVLTAALQKNSITVKQEDANNCDGCALNA